MAIIVIIHPELHTSQTVTLLTERLRWHDAKTLEEI